MWKIELETGQTGFNGKKWKYFPPDPLPSSPFPIGFVGFLGYSLGNHNSTALINLILPRNPQCVCVFLPSACLFAVLVLGLLFFFLTFIQSNWMEWLQKEWTTIKYFCCTQPKVSFDQILSFSLSLVPGSLSHWYTSTFRFYTSQENFQFYSFIII